MFKKTEDKDVVNSIVRRAPKKKSNNLVTHNQEQAECSCKLELSENCPEPKLVGKNNSEISIIPGNTRIVTQQLLT